MPIRPLKQTLGIIGTGSFGRFLADKLSPYFQIRLVGRQSPRPEYEEAAKSDFVVLSVPFDAYSKVLSDLKPIMPTDSVLIDVCSVKTLPTAAIKSKMPNHPLLATHPLFGPESAAKSVAGQTIIICPQPGNQKLESQATKLFESAGLKVVLMSEEQHDRLMAYVHGLTFFIARSLVLCGIDQREISTPSYQRLLDLANLEKQHTPELFATIQLANPYAADARAQFMAIATKLSDSLSKEKS